jgi:tRNA uridine 5-carbamoylmethylation protein Kti12
LAEPELCSKGQGYRLNPNYAAKVKEEIVKLLWVGFIKPVKRATWLSPILVVPKKNGKTSMHRLSKTEFSNHHGCVSLAIHGWRTQHSCWS